ncbi:MAG: methyltransferase domain-containing protein [Halanaerobiales bacterium]|nr:methyltransferase domain-containing protein [Halanaerobiales bacterium]
MKNVELGSGIERKAGYIGIDQFDYGQEYVRDLEKGLPFDDNSIDNYFAQHLLEHIYDLRFLMEEVWRTLKPKGIIEIVVPRQDSPSALKDPTHIRLFSDTSFDYWVPGIVKFRTPLIKAHFNILEKRIDESLHMYIRLQKV